MTYYSAFCEKPTPPSSRRAKRDPAAVRTAMPDAAVTDQRLDHSPTDPDRRSCLIYTVKQLSTATNAKTDLVRVFA
jgi:hypothetical protein